MRAYKANYKSAFRFRLEEEAQCLMTNQQVKREQVRRGHTRSVV